MNKIFILILFITFNIINCSEMELTEGGSRVKRYYEYGPIEECEFIREIESSRYYLGYNNDKVRITAETELKNRAAYWGADMIVIVEVDTQNKKALKMFAKIYRCIETEN